MASIKFDSPKLKEMQDFLTYIYTIGIENPNVVVNDGLVYHELCKYDLNKDDVTDKGNTSCLHLFDKWQKRNIANGNRKRGLNMFWSKNWDHFLQYYSSADIFEFEMKKKFIKLYIPVKYNNIFDDVNKIFDFLCNSKIKHLSKIAQRIRSDNVVIRLDASDYQSANKIINFVNDNFDSTSIGKVNPFVPTVNGVGFTSDYGGTYNGDMADLIANYIKNSVSIKEKPILSNFIKWVSEHNNSKEVQETFPLAIGVDKEINIEEKSNTAKEELFFDAIKATYDKYGIKQIIGAIKALINNNDYGMFTNGEEYYRVKMQKFITRDDAKQYIKKTLKLNSNDISDKEIVLFCYKVFGNDLYKIIYNSCMTTFYKYGENQVKNALKNVHYLNSYNGFTRFSPSGDDHTNYRDLIAKIPNDVVIDIIKLLMGIPLYSDIAYSVDQIITSFINGYIATKHISEEMNNSMSK